MTAVVVRQSKLIVGTAEDKRELYDLSSDPRELQDLLGERRKAGASPAASADPVHEETARKLEDSLRIWSDAFPPIGSSQSLDEETRKALRSLGYVD